MAEHNILGKNGEEEAVKYLISHDYTVRHRNWRRGRKELDIVAEKEDELIIVEVKTRRNNLFAEPQDAVTPLKIRRTVLAADAYLRLFQIDLPVRFDIITIVGEAGSFTVEHIKEAFYPPVWQFASQVLSKQIMLWIQNQPENIVCKRKGLQKISLLTR